jgi:hypothetical protein
MKNRGKVLMVLTLALTIGALTGCATQKAQEYSGFLKTYPAFEEGEEGVDKRYLNPTVDLGKYDGIMMDEVVFFFAPDADYQGIEPSTIAELGEEFHKTFAKELGNILTDKPGPNVARMRLAVTGLEPSSPVSGTMTTVVPVGLAVSLVKKGATGEYVGIGNASMEVEFLDSVSGERIAAAVDTAPGGKFDVGKYSPAKSAFEFWAKRVKAFMDKANLAK